MKNKLSDLNDHLFAQLERLGEEEIKGEKLQQEIERSRAITDVAKQVVSNATLRLEGLKLKADYKGLDAQDVPLLLGCES